MQYISFKLNENNYTIPILKVKEIIKFPPITRLPLTPDFLIGITNLRGRVIPIIDPKSLMGLKRTDDGPRTSKVIIVYVGQIVFGVVVDEITGLRNIEDSMVESPEKVLGNAGRQVEGVVKENDELVMLIDPTKLVPVTDMKLLEENIMSIEQQGDKVEVIKMVQGIGGEIVVKEVRSAKEFFLKELHGQGLPSPLGNALGSENKILETVCDFLDALSVQDFKRAEEVIFAIPKIGGQDLLREIGRITRKLHNSIRTFKEAIDPQLKNITQKDLPNAIDSLHLVIAKTEEAANRTMAIVEKQLDSMEDLSEFLSQITGPDDAIQSLNSFRDSLQQNLTEILLAQGFQDLTGQMIKKVIALVNDIEIELINLITIFGMKMEGKEEGSGTLQRVPTQDLGPEKISQDDVDNLLSEFGF